MTPVELEALADAAAEKAVSRTLLAIGVDVSTPEGVLGAQGDFAFLRTTRRIIGRAGAIVLSLLVAGAVAIFGFKVDLHL